MALDKNRRSLNTSFFNDPYIEDLDRNEHDVFLTLLLNPQNNLAGVYEISIKKIATFSKMEPDDVRKAINKLMDDGKILYINSWVAIKNHIKNQSINPKMAKNILEILKQVPMQMKVFVLLNDYGELEKWSQQLFDKLTDHYNMRIKKQLEKENVKYNSKIHGIPYTQDQFLLDINGIDNSINSNIKAYDTLSNPSINKKKEIGRKKEESERRNKKEESNILPTAVNNKSLHNSIKKTFLSKNDNQFTDYQKEGKAIQGLIKKAETRFPEDPEAFIQQVIEMYYELVNGNESFWNKHPFIPSRLNSSGVWDSILVLFQEQQEIDYSDIDVFQGGSIF